jgi:MinD-like ATPase involved in chromosome partitioning or flagellar assembly
MRGTRIPHDLNGEDQFVLGLSVPRLAALLLGLLAAYTTLHLSLPSPIQLTAAALAALAGAAVAWLRPAGRSLVHWAVAAVEFKLTERFAKEASAEPTLIARSLTFSAGCTTPQQPRLQVLQRRSDEEVRQLAPPSGGADDVIELPDDPDDVNGQPRGEPSTPIGPAPVYLGGPQIITLFSTKGGTGRTTLLTEVAALLASRGYYRETAAGPAQRLRVLLIDFDIASANVSARIGLAQPTLLDYLCDSSLQRPDPMDFVIRHRSLNLDVLLGPSKCVAGDRADLMGVAQAAHILTAVKAAGYQFIFLDIASSLSDLEIYLLEAVTQIYCVVTPTSGSVQSLYRSVEALRRLGLGAKLQYVANKMPHGISLAEPMSDLNGSLVTHIPYDPAFDTAENQHQPVVLQGSSASYPALMELAAAIYPALQLPANGRADGTLFSWFRRRRAG